MDIPYNGNEETLVFKWTREILSATTTLQTALLAPVKLNTLCTATLRALCNNVVFLVDVSKLSHEEDIKSDDIGSWRNNSVHKEKFGMDDKGSILFLDDHDMPPPDWVRYNLRRTYFKNKSSPDLKKYFFKIQGRYYIANVTIYVYCPLKACIERKWW